MEISTYWPMDVLHWNSMRGIMNIIIIITHLPGMSIVQYRVSPTVADDADGPSWLTVLSSDDTTKDGVTTSWVVTSMLKYTGVLNSYNLKYSFAVCFWKSSHLYNIYEVVI